MSGSTSIGNGPQGGVRPSESPDDKSTLSPGDEALPGTIGSAEDVCRCCGGSGKMPDGSECRDCSGTGKVTVELGGG